VNLKLAGLTFIESKPKEFHKPQIVGQKQSNSWKASNFSIHDVARNLKLPSTATK
jgi:hypothetical protein